MSETAVHSVFSSTRSQLVRSFHAKLIGKPTSRVVLSTIEPTSSSSTGEEEIDITSNAVL